MAVLKSDTIKLPDIRRFLGKNVMITIAEVDPVKRHPTKHWNHLGIANFKGKVDSVNIRDLAYE